MVSAFASPRSVPTKPSFCVIVGTATHTAIVVLDGEVDLACADELRKALDEQRAAGRRHVRVDASAVTFLDATVLNVLFDAHTEFLAHGGTLVLTAAGPPVLRLLTLTGLDHVLFLAEPASRRSAPPARATGRRRAGSGALRALRPIFPAN